MSAPSLYRSFLLAAGVAFLALTAVRAEDAQQIGFSDPSKPGTLKIRIGHGDVVVHAADVKDITVASDAKAEDSKPRKDGLRVIASRDSHLLTEKNNVATLEYGIREGGHDSDFKITVPRNTCLVIGADYGGDVAVYDVAGDVEVRAMSGDVKLVNIQGGAAVDTMNGEITASVGALQPGKNLSFISMNGEVHLKVPENANANVQFSTHNGTILTDFDDTALKTKTESIAVKASHPVKKIVNVDAAGVKVDVDVKDGDDNDDDSKDWHQQVHDAMRDAGREIAEASREAARAAKEAAEAIKEGANDPDAPLPPMPPMLPIPPKAGGKTVTGTINAGGPMIQVSTMNGDIVLRKAPASAPTPTPPPASQK